MSKTVAISPLIVDERGECSLWDERDRFVGKVNVKTGRALIGDSFLAMERTCENSYGRGNSLRAFMCSECHVDLSTYGDSDCDPSWFDYCPNCGARVVGVIER